ncbi:hypothetical protein F2Q68_00034692 [Brassica cretica]|uniref:ATPase AAA-type core domain-containing protein n=1 Tax=Brassica cretica TaxID=69181 RepID=A0A8S9H973_BRACR|nr:hypothetical protein F2Q68_00034692 [Brassica cretica]
MGEDDPRRGHLAHGRGRPAPRSPRPWASTTRAEFDGFAIPQSLSSLTLLDRRSSLVPPLTLASESSPPVSGSSSCLLGKSKQLGLMDIMSLNNDDDYMSEHEDSEQEMDENNPVVDESLMSTAQMVKAKHKRRHSKCWNYFTIEGDKMPDGGCDLDDEDKEDLDEEAEESKTMVARVLGKLLHTVGILPTDKADDKDYGLEALEEIMSVMDTGKIVVIFAGYSEPMKRVIASNEGFCRRVTKFFNFSDFSAKELAQILHIKMNSQGEDTLFYGFKLHESCTLQEIASVIERETTEKKRKEMNGGLVDTLLVNARENLDLRLSFDCVDTEEICTIRLEDLEAGLRVFSQ